jgi:hypothetical protein
MCKQLSEAAAKLENEFQQLQPHLGIDSVQYDMFELLLKAPTEPLRAP